MRACPTGIVQEKYNGVIVTKLLLALSSLYKAGIIHHDIKAANVLITALGKVMLCDVTRHEPVKVAYTSRHALLDDLPTTQSLIAGVFV